MNEQQIALARRLVATEGWDPTDVRNVAVASKTDAPEWAHMVEMLPDLNDQGNGGVLLHRLPKWSIAERLPDGWLIDIIERTEFAQTLAEACAKVLVPRGVKK